MKMDKYAMVAIIVSSLHLQRMPLFHYYQVAVVAKHLSLILV